MFSIHQASQVKSFKLHCESDIGNTTTATCDTILIGLKARGNTSHVIIMSIVCAVQGGSVSWRVWVEIKGRNVLTRANIQRFRHRGTSRAHTMRVHTGNTNKTVNAHIDSEESNRSSRACSQQEEHDRAIKNSLYCRCIVWKIKHTHNLVLSGKVIFLNKSTQGGNLY